MDSSTFVVMAGAVSLGAAHAFEVDHMTAVTAFVATKPRPRQAAMFGIQWAVGHGLSLLVLGSILYALKLTFSPSLASGMEHIVGVALFVLGLWTLNQMRDSRFAHTHSHAPGEVASEVEAVQEHGPGEVPLAYAHTHAGLGAHSHPHRHSSLWMGMLHGAAGTAAFVGESLVAVSQTYLYVLGFTLAFSIGVLLAMAVYSLALGTALTYGESRSRRIAQGAQVLTGVWACVVGLYWIIK